ncbi:hypothetical protein LPJ73_000453 [Coemansia sp. RSA 2703]|nr:hypothetical protein LPJ73_000453 [Coemansia sp. RSA 2703]
MSQQEQRRMQIRQRQKMAQHLAQEQEKLKGKLNTLYTADILSIARHFGNKPQATAARVTDIDNKGITIEWDWENNVGGKKSTDEMQFAFRDGASPGAAIMEISDLALEANKALGIDTKPQLTRDKEALEARTLVNFAFTPPSIPVMLSVLLGLSLAGYLGYVQDIHPSLHFIRALVSQSTCYYIFIMATGVHLLEALAVFAVCQLIKTFQPRQMSTKMQMQWTIGGALFGIFCLNKFISKILRQFAIADAMKAPSLAQQGYGRNG